jgi:hypothetical protein
MGLKLADLSVLAYANHFTLWYYRTDDKSVSTKGYFNHAADIMNDGDLIIANVDVNDTPITALYVVSDSTPGAVTVRAYSLSE